jgi:uncharacterized integral membrane protein
VHSSMNNPNNPGWTQNVIRWGPSLAIMVAIFILSSIPSAELVNFGVFDYLVKKGAHMVGYGLLALAFLRGFGTQRRHHMIIVLLLVFLYAASDELHQFFVPGRFASPVDVLIDVAGAALGLLASRNEQVCRLVMAGLKQQSREVEKERN